MSDETTPRPWSEFAESGDWWIQQCDTAGNPVGETVVGNANDMSDADMALIVRAVNAYDDLVLALAEISRVLHQRNQDGWEDRLCGIADAALAKAHADG